MRSINNHQGNMSASSNGTSLVEPKQVTAALLHIAFSSDYADRENCIDCRSGTKGIGIETARHPRRRGIKTVST